MKSKYGNKKTEAGGFMFDSKAEAKRWAELSLMMKAGAISYLMLQPVYKLVSSVKFEGDKRAKPALRYQADFAYVENGEPVIEDVKGVETDVFRIKRHLMKWRYGIDVRIIK